MKTKVLSLLLVAFFTASLSYAQEITLDNIYSGKYRAEHISGINSLKDGEHYATIERGGIAKYSYATSEKVGYIVKGPYYSYIFSEDESKILLLKASDPIYRRSFLGKYDVKDLATGKIVALNNGNWVQEPKFSPDGSKVSFVSKNNLYYQDLKSGKIVQVTTDGEENKIINAIGDWVYQEEFGLVAFYQWNKAGDALVFVRSDETKVPEMNIPIYKDNLYPQLMTFKYPKAGEPNSTVEARLYQLNSGKTIKLDLSKFENYYIPRVFQTEGTHQIVLATANRHQNKVDVLSVDTQTGKVTKLFQETDKAWIETDQLTMEFLPDNSFLWASERDGRRHLYWYNPDGKLKRQVAKGDWEITNYYGYNPKTKEVFVQTTQGGSINRVVSKIKIRNGKSEILTPKSGNSSANFSANFHYFINAYSSAATPPRYVLKDDEGKTIRELQNNDELLATLKKDGFIEKEFLQIPNEAGQMMNAYLIKPKNFDPNKKYPVFMYQYSGPGSQSVSNAWDGGNGIWFNMLAQKGYIIAVVDGRGTGYRGTDYKKVTYLNLGKYEIADQIAAAKWLGKQSYVDAARIGIFGWSFGGYMTLLAMTKGADVFKAGISVAPVTNWKYYDTIYTERFLRTPQENPDGYHDNSPTTYANLLKGKLLLIHGTADDNVHFQNSLEFVEALVQNKKQFEFMAYPDKNHGIYGGNTRYQLYTKMTNFILQNL